MKRVIHIVAILIAASMATGCASSGQSPDQMVAAAKQLDRRYTESFNHGDVAAIMDTYWHSPDLVIYPPGQMQAKGWDAVRQCMTTAFQSLHGGQLEMTESHYQPVGNAVLAWGLWKVTFPNSQGAFPDMTGRYSSVMMNKAGKWVLILDHVSVPMQDEDKK